MRGAGWCELALLKMFWGCLGPCPWLPIKEGEDAEQDGKVDLVLLPLLSPVRAKLMSIWLSPEETKLPQSFFTHC